jgi:hypothetical protein
MTKDNINIPCHINAQTTRTRAQRPNENVAETEKERKRWQKVEMAWERVDDPSWSAKVFTNLTTEIAPVPLRLLATLCGSNSEWERRRHGDWIRQSLFSRRKMLV